MKVLAIANHKGGVGKTATAHALGTILAEHGRRVLLVDVDPQASLTGACGVDDAGDASLAEVLGSATPGSMALADVLFEILPNLDLAPADITLSTCELGMTARRGRENILKHTLATVDGDYDLALIDCPPSLGLLTVNALAAAHGVLIPTQPKGQDLRGTRLFLDTLAEISADLNPNLKTVGVLVTFFDNRVKHHHEAIDAMRAVGLSVMPVRIGNSTRVAEAATIGEPLITYAPSNPQTENYRRLAKAIDKWLDVRPDKP